MRATGKNTLQTLVIEERYGILFMTLRKRAGIKACYNGSPATSVRKANFVVKVVVLECCEKTACLVAYLRLRIS